MSSRRWTRRRIGSEEAIRDRQALIFRSGVDITADLMREAPELRLLIRGGSGLDNLDLAYVEEKGLELVRIPEPGARSVAELAFAFMLGLARQVPLADGLLRQGQWAKHRITGHLLGGKTLGILGAGNIGTQVGQMGAAWGMTALGCVAHFSESRAAELERKGIELVSCDELLARSDFLSIHLPLSDTTRNLIDAAALARMKPGAILVNLARGGVVVEADLCEALRSGHIRAAGVDVHEREGDGLISPLAEFPNVLLTPHMGAGTVDASEVDRRAHHRDRRGAHVQRRRVPLSAQ